MSDTWVDPAQMVGRKGECEGRQDVCARRTTGDCPLFGLLGKPSRDGKRRVKGCGDPVARGARNRRKGHRGNGKTRKALKLEGPKTGDEEHWRGPVLVERKAGAQVGPIFTRYQKARAQAEASRAVGDHRPFVFVVDPDGTSEQLFVVSSKDWENVLAAYGEDE